MRRCRMLMHSAVVILEGNNFDRILSLKQGQEEICRIRDQSESKNFELRDGLVYRKQKDGRLLFYVPTCLINNVIRTCHDDIGHVGRDKVIENITRVYWFPKLYAKVSEYVANCLKCIEYAPNSGKREGFLHSLPKGDLSFQSLHVDHLGPFEKAGRSFRHILLVVDGFTKFTRLYPCKSTTSEEVIKHLCDYFQSYSKPKRLISDRVYLFYVCEIFRFYERMVHRACLNRRWYSTR